MDVRAVRATPTGVRIAIAAKPRSKREGIEAGDQVVVVRVRAPPADGAANERIVEMIAEILDARLSAVTITRGDTARYKEVAVDGMRVDEAVARLRAAIDK